VKESIVSQQAKQSPPRDAPRRPGRPASADLGIPGTEQIMDRALAAFAELGYEGASVRELARRLGVSHNFINDRYGSKDAFWREVIGTAQSQVSARLAAILAEPYDDELERFRDGIRAFHQAIAARPDLARILNYESMRESDRLDYVFERHIRPVVEALAPGLAALVADGRVRAFPLDVVLFSAIAMTSAVGKAPMLRKLGSTINGPADKLFDMLSEIVLDGVVTVSQIG
jgi:TetR/AcrR family transcriptional regulator